MAKVYEARYRLAEIDVFDAYIKRIEKQLKAIEKAGKKCYEKTEGDYAVIKANVRLSQLSASIRSQQYSIQRIVDLLKEELWMSIAEEAAPKRKAKDEAERLTVADIRKKFEERAALSQTEDQEAQRKYVLAWFRKKKELINLYSKEGLTQEQIREKLTADELRFRKESGLGALSFS